VIDIEKGVLKRGSSKPGNAYLDVLVDREGQRRGGGEHLELARHDLDLAGRQVEVGVALGAGRHDADHLDRRA
jgi:hypothetical protein